MKKIFEYHIISGEPGDYSIPLIVGEGDGAWEGGMKNYTQRTFTNIESWDLDVWAILNEERDKLLKAYN